MPFFFFFSSSVVLIESFPHRIGRRNKDRQKQKLEKRERGILTPATPKFSMAGIRCPIYAAATRKRPFNVSNDSLIKKIFNQKKVEEIKIGIK